MPTSAFLESVPDVHSWLPGYPGTDALTVTILNHVDEETVISLDSLISLIPQYTWNQIFHRIDQLARSKKLVLRRHRFDYMLFSNNFVA